VLDLCAGTLDFSIALLEAVPDARCAAADFSMPMLRTGRGKAAARPASPVCADALRLPFADGSFDAVLCAFGVRNLEDLGAGLAEIRRVLRPGGRVLVLDFFAPATALMKCFHASYARFAVPALGRAVSGDPRAYGYLRDSMRRFHTLAAFEACMSEAGFDALKSRTLTWGVAAFVLGEKR
jgi:demethylmenaquinone methyltransferase/2-methoxy-6-polyprenyl-1,4-benzoquinol methylase